MADQHCGCGANQDLMAGKPRCTQQHPIPQKKQEQEYKVTPGSIHSAAFAYMRNC